MEILTSLLPSGGYGYDFPSVKVNPMTFLELTQYVENAPTDPLEKYLHNIKQLVEGDTKILDCYIMDLDFLIYYKKICTVSEDLSYTIETTCPVCGSPLKKTIYFNKDITFKQIDPGVMEGAVIELGGHNYDVKIPTVRDFMKVFEVYLRYKKITDLNIIKTIALIGDFSIQANQIEKDVLGATHKDITLLMALKDLYYDRINPISLFCSKCSSMGERGEVTMKMDNLVVDFFRELYKHSPIDENKISFK